MLRTISTKVGREIKGYYSLADMGGLGFGMVRFFLRVVCGGADIFCYSFRASPLCSC